MATSARRLSRLQRHLRPPAAIAAATASSESDAAPRVAIVTGSNKGIGFEIARALASMPGHHVVACARDAAKGEAAVAQLVAEGVPPHALEFRQLDIDDGASIDAFVDWFREAQPAGLTALVNNAAIQIEAGVLAPPFAEQAAPTMHTNVYQTVALTEALRPCLTDAGRIVCVASMAVRAFDPPAFSSA
jgi:carbonyl reductase 1